MRYWLTVAGCVGVLAVSEVAAAQSIVRGEVVDEHGQPVAGASVTAYDPDNDRSYDSESDEKGVYVIVVRPSSYQFTIEKDGYRGARFDRRIPRTDGMELPRVEIVSAQSLMDAALGEINRQFETAAALAAEEKYDEAEAVFEALLAQQPDLAEAHYNLGLLLIRKQEPARAAAALERTLELRPDHAPAAMVLASVYEEAGRSDEAVALAEKVAGEHPEDAQIQIDAAYLHLNAGRGDEAQPFLERALAQAPANAEVHYLLGTVAARQGEFSRAVELLERYLALAPADDRYREPAEAMLPQLKDLLARQSAEPQPPL